MDSNTQRTEFIASSASALRGGNIEKIKSLSVRRLDTDEIVQTKGRCSWALAQLIVTGQKGITSLENPAPRLGHYIFMLRKYGLPVQTIEEPHGGPYSGTHARYHLDVPLAILDAEFAS